MAQIEFQVLVVNDVVRFGVKVRDKLSRFVVFGVVLLKERRLVVGEHVGGDGEMLGSQMKAVWVLQINLQDHSRPCTIRHY